MRLLPVTIGEILLACCSIQAMSPGYALLVPQHWCIPQKETKNNKNSSGLQNEATSSISSIFCIKNILRVGFVFFFRSPKPPVDFNMLVRASKGSSKGVGRSLPRISCVVIFLRKNVNNSISIYHIYLYYICLSLYIKSCVYIIYVYYVSVKYMTSGWFAGGYRNLKAKVRWLWRLWGEVGSFFGRVFLVGRNAARVKEWWFTVGESTYSLMFLRYTLVSSW